MADPPEDYQLDIAGDNCFIELIVNPHPHSSDPVSYFVHEKIICATSKYIRDQKHLPQFRTRDRNQSKYQKIRGIEHRIFRIYVHWLYTRNLPVVLKDVPETSDSLDSSDNSDTSYNDEEYERLLNAYIRGDVVEDLHFKNAVIQAVMELSRRSNVTPSFDIMHKAYTLTVSGSPLRCLMKDIFVHTWSSNYKLMNFEGDYLHHEAFSDVMKAVIASYRPPATPTFLDNQEEYMEKNESQRQRADTPEPVPEKPGKRRKIGSTLASSTKPEI